MDGEELELFERSLRHATESHSGAELDAALAELGWQDALEIDRRASISLIFGLQGRAGATSGALDRVITTALGLEVGDDTGVVLAAVDRWAPPGTIEGSTVTVRGVALAGLASRPRALVVASRRGSDGGATADAAVAVTVPTSSLSLRPVHGVDPWLGLLEVTATGIERTEGPVALDDRWAGAVADARLALAHELVGTSRTMLELAREHALERVQFGRPIAAFQAIRHRLAETLVSIEMAEAVIDAAWLDGSPQTAAMAKAVAGREARTAAKHCQQVLAGIGFTTEHELHRSVRRALVLNGLFGTAKSITAAFGADLLTSRRLPPLLPL
jgi:hypothetical protein